MRIKYVFHGSGFCGPLVGSAQDLGDRSHDGREPDAAREEGLREGLATVEEVEAEIRAAIDAVRTRRK